MSKEKPQAGEESKIRVTKLGERIIGSVEGVNIEEHIYRIEGAKTEDEMLAALAKGLELDSQDSDTDKKPS